MRVAAASARGEQLGRGATRPRVLDERRRMCVARRRARRDETVGRAAKMADEGARRAETYVRRAKRERVARDWREHSSALRGEASARGEQPGRGRGAHKGVFWGPTRIKTDYQLPTSILGYPRHHTGAGELAGAKNCIKKV